VFNFIAFTWSVLSGFFSWNGNTIADVSYKYPTYITPADFTFSIWGIIFFLLLLFSFCQLFRYYRITHEVQATGPWFLIACLTQGAWTVAWCYERLTLAAILMFVIFLSLAKLNASLYAAARPVQFPFTLWFGWITGATLISLVIAMYYDYGLPMNNVYASVSLVTVLGLLGIFWLCASRELGFAASVTWTSFGIYMANYHHTINVVALTVTIILLVLMLLTIARLWFDSRKKAKEGKAEGFEQQMENVPALYFPSQMSYAEYPCEYQQLPIYEYSTFPMQYERPIPSAPQPFQLV